MSRKPSPRLLDFRTRYLDHGNATLAAREAKYKNPNKIGPRLAKHPVVRAALHAKQEVALSHGIASRQERQEFWTQTMRDQALDMQHRHKGSELLARSAGDFIDKLEIQSAQLSDIVGRLISILQSTIPVELWPKVSEKLDGVIGTIGLGSNNAGLS
jgi:hypothetical protein